MADYTYLDFDLAIESLGDGAYRARVIDSPSGQGRADFTLPFSEMEIENFLLRIGRPRAGVRRLESPETEAARTFGARLFEAVFADEVGVQWRRSVDAAERDGMGLRLRLRLVDAPDLRELPWEYLHSPSGDRFVALSTWTPIVRHVSLDRSADVLTVSPPLKLLAMVSSPSDAPGLDVDAEWQRLSESLADVVAAGLIEITPLENATLRSLQRATRGTQFHIFHFIGHGGFDESSQDGIVLLEDDNGRARQVTGRELATILTDQRSMRLAVLNACEGSRTSLTDPFAGVAYSLILGGIPAVVAMQFEITDQAAIVFAHEFYAAVAEGFAVDAALAEARRAMFGEAGGVEWGTPVLHLRTDDGHLFDIDPSQAVAVPADTAAAAAVTEPADDAAVAPEGTAIEAEPVTAEPVTAEPVEAQAGAAEDEGAVRAGGVGMASPPPPGVSPPSIPPSPVPDPGGGATAGDEPEPDTSQVESDPFEGLVEEDLARSGQDGSLQLEPRRQTVREKWGPIAAVVLFIAASVFFVVRDTGNGDEGGDLDTTTTVAVEGQNQDEPEDDGDVTGQPVASNDVVAIRFAAPPDLEGDPSEFAGATEFLMTNVIFTSDIVGERLGTDSTGTVTVGYDDDNLYVAYRVADDRYDQRNTGNQIFRGDAIDINLFTGPVAEAPAAPDERTFQLTITPDAAGNGPSAVRFQGTGSGFGPDTTQLPIAAVAGRSADGFAVVASVPWSVFELAGPPESDIPALFAVFDNDGEDTPGGRPAQTAIVANVDEFGIFQQPRQWGTLRFAP